MYQLRSYQKLAVEKTIRYFQKRRDPAVIVLPTGAGKSIVIAEICKLAKGRVLILTHVKELVEQNYHKYKNYGLPAGIFSAGLGKKDYDQKVIFGGIQSVANAEDYFFENFSMVIIDECHRVDLDENTQYQEVLTKLKNRNQNICILGLTATPYRLDLGWIYEIGAQGEIKSKQNKFFKQCLFELDIESMIKDGYLTPPLKINIPVTCYDFSSLTEKNRMYTEKEVEDLLKSQKNLTPLIVQNIVDITEKFQRQGVMIFSANVKHAQEIFSFLPKDQAQIVIAETDLQTRDKIIHDFKNRQYKYLVNVSVLTTGFDAPHVDVIAIMRPTESAGLYQQIVGRGLRLDPHKKDCLILDYTGLTHNIYRPEIQDKKPHADCEIVDVPCPDCGFVNQFWGIKDNDGDVIEHFGRKCQGGKLDESTFLTKPCDYRFRFKICHQCGAQNDLTASICHHCQTHLTSAEAKLKEAKLSKNAHIMSPDRVMMNEKTDKNQNPYLEIKYYDLDGQALTEAHFFNGHANLKRFAINFLRTHLKRPEMSYQFKTPLDVIKYQKHFRLPAFVIARKQDKFWKITEKVFTEELQKD